MIGDPPQGLIPFSRKSDPESHRSAHPSGRIARVSATLLLIALLRPGASVAEEPGFSAEPVWRSGDAAYTRTIALGDVNGDGQLDLVAGNFNQSSALYLGDGARFATSPAWTSRQHLGESAALGDVDRDGDLDLVLGNFGGGTVLYRNQGGRLDVAPAWTSTRLEDTRGLALADVDGDGALDLVCGNQTAPNALYLNRGGVFDTIPAWSARPAGSTASVAVGDVNGDGAPDLVCGNFAGPTVLYLNHGGTFDTAVAWSTSDSATIVSLALGDVNGDGALDLVCGLLSGPTRLYLNRGGATPFAAVPDWSSEGSVNTYAVVLGDVDGDGDLDLACGRYGFPNALYLNEGGRLDTTAAWSARAVMQTYAAAFGDVDGDGDLDLVFGNQDQANTIYQNAGRTFGAPPAPWAPLALEIYSVALGDVDGDGDPDLVCGVHGEERLYRNEGGILSDAPAWSSEARDNTSDVVLGDVDNDGDLDFACANLGAPNTIYLNQGGVFHTRPDWSSLPSENTYGIALADVNADGYLDLIAVAAGRPKSVYLNRAGTLDTAPIRFGLAENTYAIAVGDVNRDGHPDLVCANPDRVNTLYYGVAGGFSGAPAPWPVGVQKTYAVALGDVDGDGDLDLVCGNRRQGNTLYLNVDGRFESVPAWTSDVAQNARSVALVDVDGDGDLDLVCGNEGEPSALYMNQDGRLDRTPAWFSNGADETEDVTLGDVDGDGDPDLILANAGTPSALYLGLRRPPYRGDPLAPRNQLPNQDAFLKDVQVVGAGRNLYRVGFTALDVESDSVTIVPEYQFRGVPEWSRIDVAGGATALGPLAASPEGVRHELLWDASRMPIDPRPVALRLRAISYPGRGGTIQSVASFVRDVDISVRRAVLNVSAAALRLDPVTVGDTVSVDFSLANAGNEPLTVTALEAPPFMSLSVGAPFDIAPGARRDVTLSYAPVRADTDPQALRIASTDPMNPVVSVPLATQVLELAVETEALAPGDTASLGEALTIQSIPAPGVHIEAARLFHRTPGSGFEIVEMVRAGGAFIGVIPGESVRETGIDYYVEVENSGILATDPPGAPAGGTRHLPVRPPDVLHVTAEPGSLSGFEEGRDIAIHLDLPPGSVFVEGRLDYRRGGERAYTSVPLDGNASFPAPAAIIPDSIVGPRGIEFRAWVRTSTRTLFDPPDTSRAHVIPVQVANLVEPESHAGGRYRLLTVPLVPGHESTLETILLDQPGFGLYDATRWRAFRYLPLAGHNVEFSRAADFDLEPGRCFWLISRGDHRIDTAPVDCSSVPTDSAFVMVLEPGWNPFGNPFAFPVAWSSVRKTANVGDPVAFDPALGKIGDYATASPEILEPFSGYFIENPSPAQRETLWIAPVESPTPLDAASSPAVDGPAGPRAPARVALPPPPTSGATRRADGVPGGRGPTSWSMRLVAQAGAALDGSNAFGVDPHAAEGRDSLDEGKPPVPPGSWVRAGFVLPGSEARRRLGRRDFRGSETEGHTWEIEVTTGEKGAVATLQVLPEVPLPRDFAITLVDREQSSAVELTPQDGPARYELLSFGPERPYRLALAAGTRAYVRAVAQEETPSRLTLDPSEPNPFGRATRIRFGLPRSERVRLEIYDVQGQRVATLVDRVLPPGRHVAMWSGQTSGPPVPSGVYFCRLTTGSQSLTRRVVRVD